MLSKKIDTADLIKECEISLEKLKNGGSASDIEDKIKEYKKKLSDAQKNEKKLKQYMIKVVKSLPRGEEFKDIKGKIREHTKSRDVSPGEIGTTLDELKRVLQSDQRTEENAQSHIESVVVFQKSVRDELDKLSQAMHKVKISGSKEEGYECDFKGKKFKFDADKGRQRQQFWSQVYEPYNLILTKIRDSWGKEDIVARGFNSREGTSAERGQYAGEAVSDSCDDIINFLADVVKKVKEYKPPMVLNDRKAKKAVADHLQKTYLECENNLRKLREKKLLEKH